MRETGFDYDRMVEDAMRGVVRAALTHAVEEGLPGKHHFYLSFRTSAPGVVMPSRLRAQYPQEITIVVQHQYWNLTVMEESFAVDLAFGGKREHLVVPFAALTGFADPEAQFGLRFGEGGGLSAPGGPKAAGTAPKPDEPATGEPMSGEPAPGEGEKVVSIDSFRKK